MWRKRYLLPLMICLSAMALKAQDPVFSQFFAAPLQLNPAFAGVTVAPRFTFNYRNQFSNWPSAYITYAASFEQEIEALNSGFGLQLMTDAAGDGIYSTTFISGIYGYKVKLNRTTFVRIGLEAGFYQARLDWDRLQFADEFDEIEGHSDTDGNPYYLTEELRPEFLNSTVFDASAGLLFYTSNLYAGISMKHLNRPNESFLKINENLFAGRPLRLTIHAGGEFDLGRRNKHGNSAFISPSLMFVKQGDTGLLNGGAYFGVGRVFAGVWYRHNFTLADATTLMVGAKEGVLSIAYSYDVTISELANAPGGTGNTHEISLVINIEDSKELQKKRHASRWNNCFKMFH